MWLWILSALILILVWGIWFLLAPTEAGPQADIFPLWIPIVTTVVVVLFIVGLLVYRRVRAARAARALENAIAQQAQDQALNAKPEMRAEIQELNRQISDGIAALKRSKLGSGKSGSSALYELPWYVIVGPPGAGKTTALRHSGLSFPFLDPAGGGVRGVGGTRNCDWWFTNEAILLDTAGRYTTESEDHDEWMAFLDLLLKYRSHKPINGVLVAVSVSELLDATEEGIEAAANRIRNRIDEMQATLHMVLPVYVVFTKTDLVAGFTEFFGDLKKSERAQPWGATFALGQDKSAPGQLFDAEFDLLVERLHDRAMRRMITERNRRTKEKIFQFPLEFAAVKRNLSDFLQAAFRPGAATQSTPILRGFYFSSGTQEGRPLDRVVGAMGRAFGLRGALDDEESTGAERVEAKSYFLHDVFTKVVFPDQDIAARTESELRKRRLQRFAAAAVAFVIAVLFLVPSVLSFMNNQDLIAETERISGEAADVNWSDGTDGAAKVDKLDKLRQHAEMLDNWNEEGPPLGYTWFMYQGDELFEPLLRQYISSLQAGMVQPVQERLEEKLDTVTGAKYLEDYNTLKSYLLLGDRTHLQEFGDWQAGRLTQVWAEILRPTTDMPESDLKLKLAPHVKYYIDLQKRGVIEMEPVEDRLIGRARDILARVQPTQRYYDQFVTVLIEQKYDESGPNTYENLVYPPVTLNELFIDRPEVLTKLQSKQQLREGKWFEAQGPYTYKGRAQVLASLQDGAKLLEREKWVVPLTKEEELQGDKIQQALLRVRQDYDAEYIRQWEAFFRDIDVAIPQTNRDAIEEFNILSTPDWPYQRLLVTLFDNTQFPPEGEEEGPAAGTITGEGGVVDQLRRRVRQRVETRLRVDLSKVAAGGGPGSSYYDPIPDKFGSMVEFGYIEPPVVKEGEPPPPAVEPKLGEYIANLEKLSAEMSIIEDGPPNTDTTKVTELFTEAVKSTQAMLTSMDETGQELMEPLLMNPLKQAYKAVVKGAGGAASGLWEVVVYPPYRDTIKDRYPFNLASKRDASFDDVQAFFKPKDGILWGFYEAYLKSFHTQLGHDFVPMAHLQQRPRPAKPFTPFNPNMYNCLKRADEITDALFSNGQDLSVEFQINMKTVSPIVSEVIFEVDGKKRLYRNEKEFEHKFLWPGQEAPLSGARIQVRGAGGLDEEIVREGPWGIFRLFEAADEMTAEKDNDEMFTVTWLMTAPPVSVTMEVRPRRANHPFPVSFFRGTNCPPSIGDAFGDG